MSIVAIITFTGITYYGYIIVACAIIYYKHVMLGTKKETCFKKYLWNGQSGFQNASLNF